VAALEFQDERSIRQTAIKQYPVLKAATGFMYGYKVMVRFFEHHLIIEDDGGS